MTNEKNNTNELVSDDEDPTAELEAITFQQDRPPGEDRLSESDENTYDVAERANDDAKTIGKLQYDIEQLRAKWLGLDAEIKAREELTEKLNLELDELRDTVSQKTKLLKSRDLKIQALQDEIRERDEQNRNAVAELRAEVDQARQAAREIPEPPASPVSNAEGNGDHEQLTRSEAYADSLRRRLQDVLTANEDLEKERTRLQTMLQDQAEQNRELADELEAANLGKAELDNRLATIADEHAEEIRILRFELGEAQETVSQTEDITYQLASDLVDTRGFNQELERMLNESDEESRIRIEELEAQLAKIKLTTRDLEEDLESRNDAINLLLKELAQKSEQLESIGEIGDAISDIDERISERFDEEDEDSNGAEKPHDRVTRVLVGKIGEQLLRFPLFKDRLTIGRTSDNDIQLNAGYISRRHAVVQADADATRVIDWGSKNGVYVNSKQVTEHFLKNGDIVTIGNAHFRYEERPKRDI
jgi:chromosome segregation ATPase